MSHLVEQSQKSKKRSQANKWVLKVMVARLSFQLPISNTIVLVNVLLVASVWPQITLWGTRWTVCFRCRNSRVRHGCHSCQAPVWRDKLLLRAYHPHYPGTMFRVRRMANWVNRMASGRTHLGILDRVFGSANALVTCPKEWVSLWLVINQA